MLTLALTLILAQPPDAPAKNDRDTRFLEDARAYDIRLDSAPERPLQLLDKPVMRWSNPIRRNQQGLVFLWLNGGRPEAIGTLFSYEQAPVLRTKHSFHSLAREKLVGRFGDQLAWQPPTAGVTFAPVPDAPAPAASPAERNRQMKALAAEFSATLRDPKGTAEELRMLPQALHRYDLSKTRQLDGAIYAFVLGTDPEALLLLEADFTANSPRWDYAFARFHFDEVIAKHRDNVVFRVDHDGEQKTTNLGDPASRDKVYVSFHAREERLSKPAE